MPELMALAGVWFDRSAYAGHAGESGDAQPRRSTELRGIAAVVLHQIPDPASARQDIANMQMVEQAPGVPMKRCERPMLGFCSREALLAMIGQPGVGWGSSVIACCQPLCATWMPGSRRSSASRWPT